MIWTLSCEALKRLALSCIVANVSAPRPPNQRTTWTLPWCFSKASSGHVGSFDFSVVVVPVLLLPLSDEPPPHADTTSTAATRTRASRRNTGAPPGSRRPVGHEGRATAGRAGVGSGRGSVATI